MVVLFLEGAISDGLVVRLGSQSDHPGSNPGLLFPTMSGTLGKLLSCIMPVPICRVSVIEDQLIGWL